MYKLADYIKILQRNDKVVLCNSETGDWIRMSYEVFNIIKTILDEKLNILDLADSFEDSDDFEFIKETYSQLVKDNFILNKDVKFRNVIVSLEVTHRCNLHCIHCCIDAQGDLSEKADLSTQKIKNILNKMIEWEPYSIMLSGGEAMLRTDFFELLEYLHNRYEGKIIVATNGTLINKNNVGRLCSLCDQIDISLDGVDEETTSVIRGKGVFQKVINSISLIKATGFDEVTLSMVISDKNAHLESEFRKLNERLGTKPIVRLFSPVGRGEKNKKIISDMKENEAYVPQNFLDDDCDNEVACSTCTAGMRELFINYKGDVYPCPNFIRDDCKMGNILEENSLKEIVNKNSAQYGSIQMEKADPRKKGKCKECPVNEFCWTCPGEALTFKNEKEKEYMCNLVKPVLIKRVWGE